MGVFKFLVGTSVLLFTMGRCYCSGGCGSPRGGGEGG